MFCHACWLILHFVILITILCTVILLSVCVCPMLYYACLLSCISCLWKITFYETLWHDTCGLVHIQNKELLCMLNYIVPVLSHHSLSPNLTALLFSTKFKESYLLWRVFMNTWPIDATEINGMGLNILIVKSATHQCTKPLQEWVYSDLYLTMSFIRPWHYQVPGHSHNLDHHSSLPSTTLSLDFLTTSPVSPGYSHNLDIFIA